MDKTRPTVAQLLSRTATLPSAEAKGGMLERLLGGSRDVRTSANSVLETLYLLPDMDARSGYRREDTQVQARMRNGIVEVTLMRAGNSRVTIIPGATTDACWTIVDADGRANRSSLGRLPEVLRIKDGLPQRHSMTNGVLETEAMEHLRDMQAGIIAILGCVCATASFLAQMAVGAGDVFESVVASLVAGLLVSIFAWLAIWMTLHRGGKMLEDDAHLTAPPRDASWEGLRTGYDAHGIVMERLRLRAAEAGLALDRSADARGLELISLLDGTLSRLSEAYQEALSMRGDGKTLARVETHCAQVLEEVVSGMESEAEERRLRTFEKVEDLHLHARRIVGDDRQLPNRQADV